VINAKKNRRNANYGPDYQAKNESEEAAHNLSILSVTTNVLLSAVS
jgi:hypothetical protein